MPSPPAVRNVERVERKANSRKGLTINLGVNIVFSFHDVSARAQLNEFDSAIDDLGYKEYSEDQR
jgi:hypothetical protein